MGLASTIVKIFIVIFNLFVFIYFMPYFEHLFSIISIASILGVLIPNNLLKKVIGIAIIIVAGLLSIIAITALIISSQKDINWAQIILGILSTLFIIETLTGVFILYDIETATMNKEMKELLSEYRRLEGVTRRDFLV